MKPANGSDVTAATWPLVVGVLTRPYRVPGSLILLFVIVPFYIFIPELLAGRTTHRPELPLDRVIPLQPTWALIYGSLYLFLILLPVLLVREETLIRRIVRAYLAVWITAYLCFFIYPTVAPRPATVSGEGFVVSSLKFLYSADTGYNCFPSLHVAHSFVSALTCFRVHRGVGITATVAASLVALSTLFTKQHYVIDVLSAVLLAGVACLIFLRDSAHKEVSELDRRVAPVLAVALFSLLALAVAGCWLVFESADWPRQAVQVELENLPYKTANP